MKYRKEVDPLIVTARQQWQIALSGQQVMLKGYRNITGRCLTNSSRFAMNRYAEPVLRNCIDDLDQIEKKEGG